MELCTTIGVLSKLAEARYSSKDAAQSDSWQALRTSLELAKQEIEAIAVAELYEA